MVCENFQQFLAAVADGIPGKRLRKRIRKELGDHMEDMLAEKIEAGTSEEEAKKQVLSEIGDPTVLRKDFIRAHRAEIRLTRLGIVLTLAVVVLFALFVFPPVLDEAQAYYRSAPIEEAEQALSARYTDGEPLRFLGETDYGGRIYRFYMGPAGKNGQTCVYYMASLHFFGRNYPDRFTGGVPFGVIESDKKILDLTLSETLEAELNDFAPWHASPQERGLPECVIVAFAGPTEAVYLRPLFRPVSALAASEREVTGEDISIPETPCIVRVDAPDDMHMHGFQLLDEQKNRIQS